MDFKIICPNCKSENVEPFATTDMGVTFICQDCDYTKTT
jgi:transposase-like protein